MPTIICALARIALHVASVTTSLPQFTRTQGEVSSNYSPTCPSLSPCFVLQTANTAGLPQGRS